MINSVVAKYLAATLCVAAISFVILQLPIFTAIGNLATDLISANNQIRNEIVIISIDDASLQQIGSWPWNREVFAQAVNNISAAKPQVVGFDVLFLEAREGDASFQQAINNSEAEIVLGNKVLNDQILQSIYTGTESGFVNFKPDADGKIRYTQPFIKLQENCNDSFALQISAAYFSTPVPANCSTEFKLRGNTYTLDNDLKVRFTYSASKYKQISFYDVYTNNFNPEDLQGKIVLVGSTAIDLRSNLNDNFIDIFGDSIPGVQIHANIINSFLNQKFLYVVPNAVVLFVVLVLALIFAWIYLKVNNFVLAFGILALQIVINVLLTVGLIQVGYIWPVVQVTIICIALYIFTIIYKYFYQNKENRYIKKAFARYVNPKLLGELLKNPGGLALGGEAKNMTVLFSDIRSFTSFSEKLSPTQLITLINDYLGYMSSIILKNNGTIDKYIGDAIMAFWNAPLPDADHASNAVAAALQMQIQVKDFNSAHADYPEINIGIGINTGNMTVGNVGGNDRFDYTVLGDNVNLASRLEGLTKQYGVTILCTEATVKDVTNLPVIFRLIDVVKVKGKKQAVSIYEPLSDSESNKQLVQNYQTAFEYYAKGDFGIAGSILNTIENDKASKLLYERIKLMQTPPSNWDGVWTWETK